MGSQNREQNYRSFYRINRVLDTPAITDSLRQSALKTSSTNMVFSQIPLTKFHPSNIDYFSGLRVSPGPIPHLVGVVELKFVKLRHILRPLHRTSETIKVFLHELAV